MKAQLINMLSAAGGFIVLFAMAEVMYHRLKFKVESTRKLVHGITGLMTLSFPILFTSHWVVLGLSTSFMAILILSQRLGYLQSINAVARKTKGAQLFPIVVYTSFLSFQSHGDLMFYYLPILLLSICDPIAALVGKRFPKGKFEINGHQKTLAGSFAFAISALVISASAIMMSHQYLLIHNITLLVAIGVGVTLSEALVGKGYDNVSIPLSTFAILSVFHQPLIHVV